MSKKKIIMKVDKYRPPKHLKPYLKQAIKELDFHFKKDGWKLRYDFCKDEFMDRIFGKAYVEAANAFYLTLNAKYAVDYTDVNSDLMIFKDRKVAEKAIRQRQKELRICVKSTKRA